MPTPQNPTIIVANLRYQQQRKTLIIPTGLIIASFFIPLLAIILGGSDGAVGGCAVGGIVGVVSGTVMLINASTKVNEEKIAYEKALAEAEWAEHQRIQQLTNKLLHDEGLA